MREIAVTISAVGFFVLAVVAYCSGLSPGQCALRAGIGAAALYVLTTLAARAAIAIFVDAIMRGNARARTDKADHDGN